MRAPGLRITLGGTCNERAYLRGIYKCTWRDKTWSPLVNWGSSSYVIQIAIFRLRLLTREIIKNENIRIPFVHREYEESAEHYLFVKNRKWNGVNLHKILAFRGFDIQFQVKYLALFRHAVLGMKNDLSTRHGVHEFLRIEKNSREHIFNQSKGVFVFHFFHRPQHASVHPPYALTSRMILT